MSFIINLLISSKVDCLFLEYFNNKLFSWIFLLIFSLFILILLNFSSKVGSVLKFLLLLINFLLLLLLFL